MQQPAAITLARCAPDDMLSARTCGVAGPMYKYLMRPHAEALKGRGLIRIGTLYEFRAFEKFNEAVGDSSEGLQVFNTWKQMAGLGASSVARRFGARFHNVAANVSGPTFAGEEHSLDYYLYCVTHSPSPRAMRRFGYDTCVLISEPDRFVGAVTDILLRTPVIDAYDLQAVDYSGNTFDEKPRHPNDTAPWRTKRPLYAYQAEARCRWSPVWRDGTRARQLPLIEVAALRGLVQILE